MKADAAKVADDVIGHVGTPYWVHLDLDVLDEQVLPATDYLMPGGLTFPELGGCYAASFTARRSPGCPLLASTQTRTRAVRAHAKSLRCSWTC